MHIYTGQQRRQVGGGLWSTVTRGIRPFISSLVNKLKPHAQTLGKKLIKKAVGSAANVGTSVAGNVLRGDYKGIPAKLKRGVQDEADQWTMDAQEEVQRLKRKYLDDDTTPQQGRGGKRRKTKPAAKKKKPYKQSTKSKKSINKRRVAKKTTVSRQALTDIFG